MRGSPVLIAVLLSLVAIRGFANSPPDPPVIFEPAEGAMSISPWDVHMVTAAFSDPNPTDRHRCTDWEIRTAEAGTLLWSARCTSGALALHVHLGDGTFHGVTALAYEADLVLRVRHFDSSGDPETEASLWSERAFTTGERMLIHPMILSGVLNDPPPRWIDGTGHVVEISDSGASLVILQQASSSPMARLTGAQWQSFRPGSPAGGHHPAVVLIEAGSAELELPETTLELFDQDLVFRKIYLPAVALPPDWVLELQVANDGATYYTVPPTPPFEVLARAAEAPWTIQDQELRIERIATGFRLPVDLAFAPPSDEPDAPWLYVAELYGTIRVIRRDGTITVYAEDLLDFGAEGPFPGSGEQGIGGIAVDPDSGDLLVTLPLVDGAAAPAPRVIRLLSLDGGRTGSFRTTVLELEGIDHVASHQISDLTIGPDGMLYVHVGDGARIELAREPDSFHGKILRMKLDGSAPADNPFYDSSDGISAEDYVYALGFRNPFGGAWREADGRLYAVDNGPSFDRLVEVVPGRNYLWDGSDESMFHHALYNWIHAAPVRIEFLQAGTAGGSGFPEHYLDTAVVTESGPTWSAGPQTRGKKLSLFRVDGPRLVSGPEELVRYAGFGRGTAAALALGEDGIYFSDLYPDSSPTPFDPGASIFRIRYGGLARFDVRLRPDDPMTVEVVDESTLAGANERLWKFGDEAVSSEPALAHTFSRRGVHEIRLRVSSVREDRIARAFVSVGVPPGNGLRAEYFAGDLDETEPVLARIEPAIDHDWGAGSPDEAVPADRFTARWSGSLIPRIGGRYELETIADDGVRLWIDGVSVIDSWHPGWNEAAASLVLEAGRAYSIRLESFEHEGDARVHLLWTPPFGTREPVPASVLYRPAGRTRVAERPGADD